MLYNFSSVTFTWITFQSTYYFLFNILFFFFYLTLCPVVSLHSSLVWYFILRETVKILCDRVQTQQTINCGYRKAHLPHRLTCTMRERVQHWEQPQLSKGQMPLNAMSVHLQ